MYGPPGAETNRPHEAARNRTGDRWIYENESLDATNGGTVEHPHVERWRTEETIERSLTMAEGSLIIRRIGTVAGKAPAGQMGGEEPGREGEDVCKRPGRLGSRPRVRVSAPQAGCACKHSGLFAPCAAWRNNSVNY